MGYAEIGQSLIWEILISAQIMPHTAENKRVTLEDRCIYRATMRSYSVVADPHTPQSNYIIRKPGQLHNHLFIIIDPRYLITYNYPSEE